MTAPHGYTIGVDVGRKHDRTTICIAAHVQQMRLPYVDANADQHSRDLYTIATDMRVRGDLPSTGSTETVFEARLLNRLPQDMTFPAAAATIAQIVAGFVKQTGIYPRLFIDVTGMGGGFLDNLREERPQAHIVPVYFTHGDRLVWRREGEPPRMNSRQQRDLRPWVISLGKAYLVARLQSLFESQRVRLSKKNMDAEAMRKELLDYQIKATEIDNEKYGAFGVGQFDDLVTALGLATLTEQQPAAERIERRGTALLPGVL